jgi:death-on-curing protein
MSSTTPTFLTQDEVLLIHEDLIKQYGGSPGLLDHGRFESALGMPQQQFAGAYLHPDLSSQASAYPYYLAKGHAFVDGNKRIAAACANVFLLTNGLRLTCSDEEYYQLTLGVADGSISKDQATEFFRDCIAPKESTSE